MEKPDSVTVFVFITVLAIIGGIVLYAWSLFN